MPELSRSHEEELPTSTGSTSKVSSSFTHGHVFTNVPFMLTLPGVLVWPRGRLQWRQ